jgi:sugar phosphate isomerase/epimerase
VELCFNAYNHSALHGLPADIERSCRAARDAGFEIIALDRFTIDAFRETGGTLADVRRMIDAHGLRCFEIVGMAIDDSDERSLAGAAQLAEIAGALAAPYVLVVVDARLGEETTARFGRCADVISVAGARIGLEFMPTRSVRRIADAVTMCRAVGLHKAQVLLDSWHFFRGDDDWADLDAIPVDALGYIQFDDALPMASDDIAHEVMHRRALPGAGELDLWAFAEHVKATGWDGVISIEVLSAELRQLEVETFAKMAMEATRPYWL